MSGVHIHLLVNHVPILGALFALTLLAASFKFAPDVLRRTALVVLVGVGIAGAAANYSGEPAEDAIRGFPGVQRAVIHEHEEFAEKSFLVGAVIGALALGMLIRWRRAPMPRAVTLGALASATVVCGMMAYTGLLGGQVRHTEVRPDATAADAMTVEPRRPSGQSAPQP